MADTEQPAPLAAQIDVNGQMLSMFAEAMKGYMQGSQAHDREFAEDWRRHTDEMNGAVDKAMSGIDRGRHRPPPLPKEVQEIVGFLQAMPQMVPVVRQLIDRYMQDVAKAYEAVNAKYTAPLNGQPNEVSSNQPG